MDEVEYHKRLIFEGEEWVKRVLWDHPSGWVDLKKGGLGYDEGWWFHVASRDGHGIWNYGKEGGPYQTAGAAMRAMVKILRGERE